jgi:hypothetical protein
LPKHESIITLRDLLRLGADHLVPEKPVSLYRYIELLVQLALLQKYRFECVLETGPGTYPVFEFWPRKLYGSGTVVDYNEKVLDHCDRALKGKDIERVQLDFDRRGELSKLGRKWNLIISNGVIEHLQNDADHVRELYAVLDANGMVICTTVLHNWLFNDWDRAVGHYRRYPPRRLISLFDEFSGVQYIPTSYLQEAVRPLFFGRVRHLLGNAPEMNNRLFGEEVTQFSRPPYASIFRLVRWSLPIYLCMDWWLSRLLGGIAIIVARK